MLAIKRKKNSNLIFNFTEKNINILHIDDNEEFLELTKLYFEKQKDNTLKFHSLSNPNLFFDELKKSNYDIIVCDYDMPNKDGLECLRELGESNFQLPFIMFTGKSREEIAIKTLNLGANFYITKGSDTSSQFKELEHVIRTAVHQFNIEKTLIEREERYRLLFQESQVFLQEQDHSELKKDIKNKGITNLRDYLDQNPNELFRIISLMKIVDANKSMMKFLNIEKKEDLMGSLGKIISQESYESMKEEIIALLEGRTYFVNNNLSGTLHGEKIYLRLVVTVPYGYEESLSKVFVSLIDITSLKKAELKAIEEKKILERKIKDLVVKTK